MAVQEIRPASLDFQDIEAAAKAAIPRATVLRVQFLPHNRLWLVLLNTQRTYGHFAILEWNTDTRVLHSGRYFDSMSEAVTDFEGRGGDLSL